MFFSVFLSTVGEVHDGTLKVESSSDTDDTGARERGPESRLYSVASQPGGLDSRLYSREGFVWTGVYTGKELLSVANC